MRPSAKFITQTALFIALGIVFPIVFHQFGLGGRIFLPMHIPVLLAGSICGISSGLLVGIICPGLSFLLTGMPPSYAVPLMTAELGFIGITAGLIFHKFKLNIYIALIAALIVGRLGFALALLGLSLFLDMPYGLPEYFGGAVITGIPGIAVQLIIIPPIVAAIKRRDGN
ncbi:MAG: ECF transporter S component [candidate division Zixibacteria bacterium]